MNRNFATTWYVFFNRCESVELEKSQIFQILKREISQMTTKSISEKSLDSDIDVLLSMYSREKKFDDPEDKSTSPFSQLGLIKKTNRLYNRSYPNYRTLDRKIILYELTKRFESEAASSLSIESLIAGDGSIGGIFQIHPVELNIYFDALAADGYIRVDRTAGLDVIYRAKDFSAKEVLEDYYTNR